MSYEASDQNPHVMLCRKCTLRLTAPEPADQPRTASRQEGREFGWYGVHPRTTRTCYPLVTGPEDGVHPKTGGNRGAHHPLVAISQVRRQALIAFMLMSLAQLAEATEIRWDFTAHVIVASGSLSEFIGAPVTGAFIYDTGWPLFGMANPQRATYVATTDAYGMFVSVSGGAAVFNSRDFADRGDHLINIQNDQTLSSGLLFDEFSYAAQGTMNTIQVGLSDFVVPPETADALDSLSLDQQLVLALFNRPLGAVSLRDETGPVGRIVYELDTLQAVHVAEPVTLVLLSFGLIAIASIHRKTPPRAN